MTTISPAADTSYRLTGNLVASQQKPAKLVASGHRVASKAAGCGWGLLFAALAATSEGCFHYKAVAARFCRPSRQEDGTENPVQTLALHGDTRRNSPSNAAHSLLVTGVTDCFSFPPSNSGDSFQRTGGTGAVGACCYSPTASTVTIPSNGGIPLQQNKTPNER